MATSGVTLSDALDADALEAGFRVRRIRDRLFGQTLDGRIAQARARYGRVYTLAELRAAAGPRRRARCRRSERGFMESVEAYQGPIPDDALLRYDDARETESFSQFWVVTPASSGRDRPERWIAGQLRGGMERYAIVARWRTPAGPAGHARALNPNPRTREGETS